MTCLNEEMVKVRAQEIRENLDKVRHHASLSDEDFWADERNLYTDHAPSARRSRTPSWPNLSCLSHR